MTGSRSKQETSTSLLSPRPFRKVILNRELLLHGSF